jgi:hypothetical protein
MYFESNCSCCQEKYFLLVTKGSYFHQLPREAVFINFQGRLIRQWLRKLFSLVAKGSYFHRLPKEVLQFPSGCQGKLFSSLAKGSFFHQVAKESYFRQ